MRRQRRDTYTSFTRMLRGVNEPVTPSPKFPGYVRDKQKNLKSCYHPLSTKELDPFLHWTLCQFRWPSALFVPKNGYPKMACPGKWLAMDQSLRSNSWRLITHSQLKGLGLLLAQRISHPDRRSPRMPTRSRSAWNWRSSGTSARLPCASG